MTMDQIYGGDLRTDVSGELDISNSEIELINREIRRIKTRLDAFSSGNLVRASAIQGVIPPVNGGSGTVANTLGAVSIWMNAAGATRVQGDVVVENGDRTFGSTTTPGDLDVIGVLDDASVAVGVDGHVRHLGYQSVVNVMNAVAVGDYLWASATAGAAESAGASPVAGVFARALTVKVGAGAGAVKAFVFPVLASSGGGAFVAIDGSTPLTGDWDAGSTETIGARRFRAGGDFDIAAPVWIGDADLVVTNDGYAIFASVGYGAEIDLVQANGSLAVPTISALNDVLGGIFFVGYDGTQSWYAGEISGRVDGTPGVGNVPLRLEFWVAQDAVIAMRLRNSAIAEFASHVELRNDLTGGDGLAHEARFFENVANGTNYIGLKAPPSLASSQVFALPVADGAVGAALRTDAAGNLSLVKHSGSSTITAAATSVVIAHGCASTPAAADITITPTSGSTVGIGEWWVDTIGGTNFTVHVAVAPGLGGWTFDWRADLP